MDRSAFSLNLVFFHSYLRGNQISVIENNSFVDLPFLSAMWVNFNYHLIKDNGLTFFSWTKYLYINGTIYYFDAGHNYTFILVRVSTFQHLTLCILHFWIRCIHKLSLLYPLQFIASGIKFLIRPSVLPSVLFVIATDHKPINGI